jgi:nitroimidazol reductase NimA-like FMN-containing flavoprotein (pyridoxamine 5'-phosphate oxidase superfamily)
MLRAAKEGVDICVTVTLLDGLVLARSVYNHSMNYRSVVVLGRAREVTDGDAKLRAMQRVVEHVVPGRWSDARRPSDAEIKATTILALPLDEASANIRSGPPTDDDADLELAVWAGVIPLGIEPGAPVPASGVDGPPPAYAAAYERLT